MFLSILSFQLFLVKYKEPANERNIPSKRKKLYIIHKNIAKNMGHITDLHQEINLLI